MPREGTEGPQRGLGRAGSVCHSTPPSTRPHTSLDVYFINCYRASPVCQARDQTQGLSEYKAAITLLSS